MTTQLNVDQLNTFMNVYAAMLARVSAEHPDEYPWARPGKPYSLTVETVVARMRAAILADTASYEGRAFRATCRFLRLRPTRKAIRAFLRGDALTPVDGFIRDAAEPA